MTTSKHTTEFTARLQDVMLLSNGQIDKQRITAMIWKHYAGNAAREVRREICNHLTGKELYIAHCGVNAMAAFAIEHLQAADMGSVTISPKVATAAFAR